MRPKVKQYGTAGTYTALGYRSAGLTSSDGISVSRGSGDLHMRYDRPRLLDMSRMFYRDNAIYCGMVRRAVSYVIGNGFGLQMNSKSKSYNDDVERLWRDFWVKPEIRGLLSGRKVEKLYCQEGILCGDATAIKTDKALLQLFDAEQLTGKGYNDDGIAKDNFGTPTRYFIARYGRGGTIDRRTATGYDPRHVLFMTDPERPSSTRGVPKAQASFPMLHRINDVCDSEAIAWQLLARLAVSLTRDDGPTLAFNEGRADPDAENTASQKDLAAIVTDLGYALMFHAKPGEKIEAIDRKLPGKDFPASIRMFLRLLGLPMGLPLEIILLDWTKSNYSQSRAVLEQAYQTFIDLQLSQIEALLTPTLEWKIYHWIEQGLLKLRKDGFKHNWITPTFPWIDQLKEVQAYGQRVDRGFGTHGQVCKSLNSDRDALMDVRVREVQDAIERAKKITKETGEAVPWQIFAGLEASKTTPQKEEPDDAGDKDEDDDE